MSEYGNFLFTKTNADENRIMSELKSISLICDIVFLVTNGAAGIFAVKKGVIFYEAAPDGLAIVNTNGAGDAAAGGFLSTYIGTNNVEHSLKFSVVQANMVLNQNTGIL